MQSLLKETEDDAGGLPKEKVRRGTGFDGYEQKVRIQKILRILSPFFLLILWELATRVGLLDSRFFPAPTMIIDSAVKMIGNGSIFKAAGISLYRLFTGYMLGALLGIIIGLWLGLSSWSRSIFEPWIQVTYPIPKLAVYPLLLLIVGMGETPIIVLLAIATFYIVVISTIAAVLSINKTIIDVGKDNNANFLQFFMTIAFPASMPQIVTSLEVSLGIAYIVLIAAEFLSSGYGLGFIIWTSWTTFDIPPMYVSMTVISVLGYFSVIGVRVLGDTLMPWRKSLRR